MVTIRPYRRLDFDLIQGWWQAAHEVAPLPGMMPTDSSFVLEYENRPVLAIACYLTNTPEVAYLECFVGAPDFKGTLRRQLSQELVDHCYRFLSQKGYKRVCCLAHKPGLKQRYQELGMTQTLDNVATFVRELG